MILEGIVKTMGNSIAFILIVLVLLLALASHPVKFVEEFDQRPFFDPGHIGAGDAQFPGDFPLGFFLAAVQSETVADHFLFPWIEDV